jgi:hypothetical protein
MNLNDFQKNYPEFIYKSCGWKIENGDLVAGFCFVMGDIEFNPRLIIRGVDGPQIEKIGKDKISNLVFNMGMAEIPTYWKTACAPKIIVEAGYLDKAQIAFWRDLIENGMVQFSYENKLKFLKPDIETKNKKPADFPVIKQKFKDRYLVPMGGGKDSVVTLELLRAGGKDTATFELNPADNLRPLMAIAGGRNIIVERIIDKKLIELNRQGFLNGHTPFSSILSFLGVALAALFDYTFVAISQERSSNEGNVVYRQRTVNHQYSKTFEFENKFRKYSEKYLAKKTEYFSFLRPFYELQIAKIFSNYPKYFSTFLSCNKSFTLAARQQARCASAKRQASVAGWCGNCPKCLFMFAALYPFIGRSETVKIFGKNLFDEAILAPLMAQLLGESVFKPFECVGTFAEVRVAFYLSLKREKSEGGDLPVLLGAFENEYLPNYRGIEKNSQKILADWNNKNNLPNSLKAAVKLSLRDK